MFDSVCCTNHHVCGHYTGCTVCLVSDCLSDTVPDKSRHAKMGPNVLGSLHE